MSDSTTHRSEAVESLDRLMVTPGATENEVAYAAEALSLEDLGAYSYGAFLMNMHSVFSGRRSYGEIVQLAREATLARVVRGWVFHKRLRLGDRKLVEPTVPREMTDAVDQLHERGRGVMTVSFHQGQFRNMATDLSMAGKRSVIALAQDAYDDFENSRAHSPDFELWEHMNITNVEDTAGGIALAKAMRRKETVIVLPDGNTGSDGPKGDENRREVDILGRTAFIKDGAFKLAARFGVPILPGYGFGPEDNPELIMEAPIDPGGPLKGEEADAFVDHAIRELYAVQFARNVETHPGEWESCGLFHRWRKPEAARLSKPGLEGMDLGMVLEEGRALRRDEIQFVEIVQPDATVWTHARSMKSMRFQGSDRKLISRLSAEEGVDRCWLDSLDPDTRKHYINMLSALGQRHVLRAMSVAS